MFLRSVCIDCLCAIYSLLFHSLITFHIACVHIIYKPNSYNNNIDNVVICIRVILFFSFFFFFANPISHKTLALPINIYYICFTFYHEKWLKELQYDYRRKKKYSSNILLCAMRKKECQTKIGMIYHTGKANDNNNKKLIFLLNARIKKALRNI